MTKTLEQHRADLLEKYGHEHKQTFGSGGFVFLDEVMGWDADIARIARVSYGEGTKTVNDDTALIRRLIKDYHSSPCQQVMIRFFVRAPLELVQQMKTHRTFQYAQFNQYSQRYSLAINEMATVAPNEWRKQSTSNKQGSAGFITEWPVEADIGTETPTMSPGQFLTDRQGLLHHMAMQVYKERIDFGVAREQARSDLPLSNYTELFFTVDLHNLLHFLSLRLDPHAQQEIRELAGCLAQVVQDWVPVTYQAFLDYRVNAISFSAQEIEILRELITNNRYDCLEFIADNGGGPGGRRATLMKNHGIISLNERAGFINKLKSILGSSDD